MPANVEPIFSRLGSVSNNDSTGMNQLVTAAANDVTGVSANNSLIFTADPTNGSYIVRIRLKPGGTNIASMMRFYINNGSTPTTATNNVFHGDVSLPATTASIVVGNIEIDYPCGFALPVGFRLYMGLGTAVAAGWVATVIAGRY